MDVTKEQLQVALERSWTRETSSTPDQCGRKAASRGQCVPTALVAQDFLGGDLQKLTTIFNGKAESHYRNISDDGVIFDATRSQYPDDQELRISDVRLDGFKSIREKRLSDPGTRRRYEILKSRVEKLVC